MKFKVGDRVRVKWSRCFPEAIGKEFVINGFSPYQAFHEPVLRGSKLVGEMGYLLAPHLENDNGFFSPSADQLEPILPSGETEFFEAVKDWVVKNPLADVREEREDTFFS